MIVLSLFYLFLLILALIGFPNFSFSGRFSQSLDNLFFAKHTQGRHQLRSALCVYLLSTFLFEKVL